MRRLAACAAASMLLLSGIASGAGFAIYEQGAKATGMGGSAAGIADTPSAIFYNPAGLGFQKGLGLEIGDTLIFPQGEHEDPGTGEVTEAEPGIFYPPTFYASYVLPQRVAFGLGLFVPYGLGIHWPSGWAGFEEIEKIDVQNIFLNPTVAWAPLEWLSIAAGFDAVHASVELRKGLDFVTDRGTLHGAAEAWGFGANAGVLFRFLDGRLSWGVSYRSAVKLDFEGDADFQVPLPFESMLEDQPLESRLVLPHSVAIGMAGLPAEWLTLSLDVVFTTWSTFREFGFTFPEDEGKPEDEQLSSYEPRDWKNVFGLRLGGELRPPCMQGVAFRLGLVYDRNPSPSHTMSPSLPDSDRIDVSAGAGYTFRFGLSIDLAYMLVWFFERTSGGESFPGTYRSHAHLVGLSLGYRFDPVK